MELVKFNDFIDKCPSSICATIGDFDGVHLAHAELINNLLNIKKEHNIPAAVITFDPHPAFVIPNHKQQHLLSSLEDKFDYLSIFDIDYLIVIPFSNDVAVMKPLDFVNDFLKKINISNLVVGFDFQFGYNREGKAEYIQQLSENSIDVTIINEIDYDNTKISSTRIRNLLSKGNVVKANKLLGHYFKIHGEVVHGNKVGSKINVPTANFTFEFPYVHLKHGVYVAIIKIKNKYCRSILNIGHNPSFNYSSDLRVEAHLLDINEDLYGLEGDIFFIDYIREEKKFDSKEEFVEQIKLDKDKCCNIISNEMLNNLQIEFK